MRTLFQNGGGASHFWVEEVAFDEPSWIRLKTTAVDLLRQRGQAEAADFLEASSFTLWKGTNDFGDNFHVLYKPVGLEDYVRYDDLARSVSQKVLARIVQTFEEVGYVVRFVGVELVKAAIPSAVPTPIPRVTTEVVSRALDEAERLVSTNNPESAVDRTHTALHGYLKGVCVDNKLIVEASDMSLTELLKHLRERHPVFANGTPHYEQTGRILKALAVICDALNPIRNRGSLAHSGSELLGKPEALLVINASRSILRFLHDKLEI